MTPFNVFWWKQRLRILTGVFPKFSTSNLIKNQIEGANADADLYLIGTNTGGSSALLTFDILLGLALICKGKRVKFVLCDGALPICQMCEIASDSPKHLLRGGLTKRLCTSCYSPANNTLRSLGFETIKLSDHINLDEGHAEDTSVHAGHAKAGFLRYTARGTVEDVSSKEWPIMALFDEASARTYSAYISILRTNPPRKVIFHHGIYVPQGAALQAAKDCGIEVVTWCVSYRKASVMLAHGDSYHYTMPLENRQDFDPEELTVRQRSEIEDYISSREKGTNDWVSFSKKQENNHENLLRELCLEEDQQVYLLLTNVMWDANLHFKASIFSGMLDWIEKTITAFQSMPEKTLIIRIHPAEVHGTIRSRQLVEEEIKKRFDPLPHNVLVVSPDNEKLDTYSLIELCDVALVYGTKATSELAIRKKPVIVAGSAWAGGKGFTIDPQSEIEYLELLSSEPSALAMRHDQHEMALAYGHYFFFKRMITVALLTPQKFLAPFKIKPSLNSLEHVRKDKNLSFIADRVIDGKPFCLPDTQEPDVNLMPSKDRS